MSEHDQLHMMIDVEALRLKKPWKAPLLSVGIVIFNQVGQIVDKQQLFIDQEKQIKGVKPEKSTIQFWNSEENKPTLDIILKNCRNVGMSPLVALEEIEDLWKEHNCQSVWFAHPEYDKIVLVNYYNRLNRTEPWTHRQVRDFCTIRAQNPGAPKPEREGTYHMALDDAIYQVSSLRNIVIETGNPLL